MNKRAQYKQQTFFTEGEALALLYDWVGADEQKRMAVDNDIAKLTQSVPNLGPMGASQILLALIARNMWPI